MDHAKHIVRAALLLVLIAVAFVFVRHFAVPDTFGEVGHYRLASVAEHADKPLTHGAPGACAECHEDTTDTLSTGRHSSVSCEVCHAPLATHVTGGQTSGDMPVRRSYKLCARCHQRLGARPKDFAQVVLRDHVADGGKTLTEEVCVECHDAHDPSESP